MAPTTTGTNVVTQQEDLLIDHIANLAAFQTLTSTADATEAKTHIYVEAFADFADLTALMARYPYVLISPMPDSPQIVWDRYASGRQFICTHHYMLRFERFIDRPNADDVQELERKWKNLVGDVMEAFKDDSGLPGRFNANRIWPADVAQFSREDNKTHAVQCWEWNVENTVEQE